MPQLKIPINSLDLDKTLAKSRSQAGQDLFVIAMLQGKTNGTFLEIGCNHPEWDSNTFLLEKNFNFTGDSIDCLTHTKIKTGGDRFSRFYNDVKDKQWPDVDSFENLPAWIQNECIHLHGYNPVEETNLNNLWRVNRPKARFHCCDALLFDYSTLPPYYDYLQIDIDPPIAHLTLLQKIIPQHEFSVITFEHDIWRGTDEVKFVQEKSREFLSANNYTLLVDDVTIQPGKGYGIGTAPIFFEDWYVNKKFINQDIIDVYKFINPATVKYYPDILFNSK